MLNISRSNESVGCIDLVADGAGHIYMTWEEKSDVFFCRSIDSGASWHFPVRMNVEGENARTPSLNINERGDIFLAWMHSDIPDVHLAVSHDLGNTWDTRNFDLPRRLEYLRPLLASQAGGLVYLFNGRNDLFKLFFDFYSSLGYGNNWQVQEVAAGDVYIPLVKYPLLRLGAGKQIYIVWGGILYTGRMGPPGLYNYFLRLESSGAWAGIQNLHDVCPTVDEKTALAISGDSVDTVLTGLGCLFLLRSKDKGRSWPVPEIVPGSDGYHMSSSQDMVFHPSGKTFLVFVRKTTPMDGCLYLIYFK